MLMPIVLVLNIRDLTWTKFTKCRRHVLLTHPHNYNDTEFQGRENAGKLSDGLTSLFGRIN